MAGITDYRGFACGSVGMMLTVTLHIQSDANRVTAYEATFTDPEEVKSRGRLVTLIRGTNAAIFKARHARDLTNDESGSLLQALAETKVKPLSSHAIGRGGTFYMLKIERGFNTATFTWWNSLPAAWRALSETVERLVGYGAFENTGK